MDLPIRQRQRGENKKKLTQGMRDKHKGTGEEEEMWGHHHNC